MASKYFRRLSTTVSAAAVFGGDKSKAAKVDANIQSVPQEKDVGPERSSANDVTASDPFDVQKLRRLLSNVSSSEDFSETSSVSTFRHGDNKKGSSKFGFGFSKKKKKLSVVLFSINDEFTRLRDQWVQRCNESNTPLSPAVLAEFKKRIGQAAGAKSKPKLNLAKCDLTDGQLILFVEELAHRPVVAKLDLTGNHISSTGAEYLKKLLVYQLEVSTLLEPQQRVAATFLSDISLNSSKQTISKEIVDEIASVAGALAVCNVQNSVYELYMEISTPDSIDLATLTAMWEELLGTGPERKALLLGRPGCTAQTASWTYAEAEALIVEEYRRRGLLPRTSSSQEKALDAVKQKFERRPSASSVASSADGGRHAEAEGSVEGSLEGSGDWATHDADEPLPPHPNALKRAPPVPAPPTSSPKPPSGASKHATTGEASRVKGSGMGHVVSAALPAAGPNDSYTSHEMYVPDVVHADSGIAMQADEAGDEDDNLLEELEEAEELAEEEEIEQSNGKGDEVLPHQVSSDELSGNLPPLGEPQVPNGVLAIESPRALESSERTTGAVLPSAAKSPVSPTETSAPPFKPHYTLPFLSKGAEAMKEVVLSAPPVDPQKSPTARGPSPAVPVKLTVTTGSLPTTPPAAAPAPSSAGKAIKASGSIAQRYLQAVDHSGNGNDSHSPSKPVVVQPLEKSAAATDASPIVLPPSSSSGIAPATQTPKLPSMPALLPRNSAAAALFGRIDHDDAELNDPATEIAIDRTEAPLYLDQAADIKNEADIGTSATNEIHVMTVVEGADEQDTNTNELAIDLDDEELDLPLVVNTASLALSTPPPPPSLPAPPAPSTPPAIELITQALSAPAVPTSNAVPAATPGSAELDGISHSSSKLEVEEQPDLYSVSPESSVDGAEFPAPAASSWHSESLSANEATYGAHPQSKSFPASDVPQELAEPRVHAVLGISRKKFTAREKDLLESLLPHCREVRSPYTREHNGHARVSDFLSPRRAGEDVRLIDLSSRDLMDSDFVEDDEIGAQAASAAVLAVGNNRLSNLAALALPLQFTVLQELDLGFNYIAGRISMHMLPRTLLKLDLSHNGIIDYGGVMVCTNLKELNLSYNCIETIHALPKTLERLNIAHNYIWSKVCLRLLALTPKLASLSLEGNPVTLLVPGWAAQLRSMSNKLAHLDGRPVAPAHSAPVIGIPFTPVTNVLKATSTAHSTGSSAVGKQDVSLQRAHKSSPHKQKSQDEVRSQLHAALVAEREEKRRLYMESLRKCAKITSPSKLEAEILQHAKRLSSPKFAPSTKFQKKKGKPVVSGFGCGRSEHDSFLSAHSDWSRREQDTAALSEPSRAAPAAALATTQIPKLTQAAALTTVGEWSSKATQILDDAANLVNDLDTQWRSQHCAAQEEDLHRLQARVDELQLAEWSHLPVQVKLALYHLSKEHELVSTIMHLHEQIRNYGIVLQQIRGALALCVRESRSFSQPFQITMSSALGKSLTTAQAVSTSSLLPTNRTSTMSKSLAPQSVSNEEKEVLVEKQVSEAVSAVPGSTISDRDSIGREKPEPNIFVEEARSRLSARMLNSSSTSAAVTANSSFSSAHSSAHSLSTSSHSLHTSSSRSLRDRHFQTLTDTTLLPWQTSASETLARCADLLAEVLNFSAQTEANKEEQEDKLQFLALFRAKRNAVEFSKFDKLPKDVSAAIATNSTSQLAVIDAQAAIRAFAKLFSQIENVLLLCIKSGLVFEPALQALMNSGLGRVVKKATQGFKAVTIVAPRSRSPSPRRSPNARQHARSPALTVVVDDATFDEPAPTPTAVLPTTLAPLVPSPRQKLTPHSSTLSLDLFAAAQEAFMATTGAPPRSEESQVVAAVPTDSSVGEVPTAPTSPRSPFAALDESFEELEFAVIDPNEDVVRRWMQSSEAALGRAAVLLNTLIDLASGSKVLTERNIVSFRSELAGLDLLAFEPPPKEVAAALLVCGDVALSEAVRAVRQRLDDYDNLFGQVDNALLLSVEDGHNFRNSFDALMRTKLGLRINESAFGIYDY